MVRGNSAGGNPQLNLKGFFVGNAWTVAALVSFFAPASERAP